MKKNEILRICTLLFLVVNWQGCAKISGKLEPKCNGSAATYTSNVKTIIDNNCISCHSSFTTYSGLTSVTSSGDFEKYVMKKQTMPKGSELTQDELNTLQCWVESGYPEN